jgi:hypothetical protein
MQFLIASYLIFDGISVLHGYHFFFVVGFIFYMLLFPLFHLLGLAYVPALEVPRIPDELVARGVVISTVGIFAYLIGRSTYNKFILKRGNNAIVFNKKIDSSFLKQGGSRLQTNLISSILFLVILSFFLKNGLFNKVIIFLVMGSILSFQYKMRKILFFFTAILALYFSSFSAGRRDIIGAVICLFVIYQYFGWRRLLNIMYVGLVALVAIISGSLYITVTRSFDGSEPFLSYMTLTLYKGYGSVSNSLLKLGDFGVSYDNYLQIVENISEIGYLWGVSFIRLFFSFIPRSIWQEKPLDVQQLIMVKDIALTNYAGGQSQGMTLIGEFYWNFGLPSVVFGMFLFGILMSYMDKCLLSRNPAIALASLSALPFAFFAWRGAFNSGLIYFLATAFLLFLIYTLSDTLQKLIRSTFKNEH